jgi:hypothetical protein
MVGAKARELYAKQAKDRQKQHGGTAPGKKKTLPATLPGLIAGDTRDRAGKAVGVSGKSGSVEQPLRQAERQYAKCERMGLLGVEALEQLTNPLH